jgi:hypothetical protein
LINIPIIKNHTAFGNLNTSFLLHSEYCIPFQMALQED